MRPPSAQPGWYDDPQYPARFLRWWDGERWTEHLHQRSRFADASLAPRTASATSNRHPNTTLAQRQLLGGVGIALLVLLAIWSESPGFGFNDRPDTRARA